MGVTTYVWGMPTGVTRISADVLCSWVIFWEGMHSAPARTLAWNGFGVKRSMSTYLIAKRVLHSGDWP